MMHASEPSGAESRPDARGLLRGYFTDWDDINRFIAEERSGWEDRDSLVEEDRDLLWKRFDPSPD